jgi:hypothetical protein
MVVSGKGPQAQRRLEARIPKKTPAAGGQAKSPATYLHLPSYKLSRLLGWVGSQEHLGQGSPNPPIKRKAARRSSREGRERPFFSRPHWLASDPPPLASEVNNAVSEIRLMLPAGVVFFEEKKCDFASPFVWDIPSVGGGRAPPRTTRAAFRKGVPTFSGSRGLGRGTRKTQAEWAAQVPC